MQGFTVFEEIHTSDDLRKIQTKYLKKGETGFANLGADLSGSKDFGITIRRMHKEGWEPQFVSVIDCRGEKIFRSYFTKWHELAHLLTLTAQMRLEFRRSHSQLANHDPEERLMDIIAGELGFLSDFLPSDMRDDISFGAIERIRQEYCPTASRQAAMIGIVKALPKPCILLSAQLALRKSEAANLSQMILDVGLNQAVPALRAVHVTVNEPAREEGIQLHKQWRVSVVEKNITQLQDDVSIAKKEAIAARSQTTEMAKKLTFVNGMIMRCGQLLTQEQREKYGSELFEEFKSSDGLLAEFFDLLGLDLSKWRKWESQYGEDSLAMVKAFEDSIRNEVGMLSLLRLKLSKMGIDVDAINAARDYRDVKIGLAELKQRATRHIRFETAGSSPKIILSGLRKELLPRLTEDALREASRKLKNDPAKKLEWLEIVAELLLADSGVASLLPMETSAARSGR